MYTDWFAGVNSPVGFYSHFDMIASDFDTRKIYIKGGSGMGKSTFMKRVRDKALEEGFFCELFHCSSDCDSLDGINIPEKKLAIVDATSPHISDPEFAGLTGKILNTAEFLDPKKVEDKKEDIAFFMKQKADYFKKGYAYLSSAKSLMKSIEKSFEKVCDNKKVYQVQQEISKKIFKGNSTEGGSVRKLFLTAVCYDGIKNYSKQNFKNYSVIAIKGKAFTSRIIKNLADEAVGRGYDIILCPCPMNPAEKYEHLIIPSLAKAVTTYSYYHHYDCPVYDLDECYSTEIPDTAKEEEYTEKLINMASTQFEKAKTAHRFIEKQYIPAMDFDGLSEKFTGIIENIFQ